MFGERNYIDGKEESKFFSYYASGEVQWEANYVVGNDRVRRPLITTVEKS